MPDDTQDPKPDPAPSKEPDKNTDKGEADLGDAGKKALDAERQARREAEAKVKELEPLAARAKKLEEANKTESEKLTEKLTAAEKRAVDAELAAARVEVAASKGLTPTQARRLVGTTREELEDDADASIADGTFVIATDPRRPAPNPDQGKEPSAKEDPDAWLRDKAARR